MKPLDAANLTIGIGVTVIAYRFAGLSHGRRRDES